MIEGAAKTATGLDGEVKVSSQNSHQMSTTENNDRRRESKDSEVSMFDDDNTCEMLI